MDGAFAKAPPCSVCHNAMLSHMLISDSMLYLVLHKEYTGRC